MTITPLRLAATALALTLLAPAMASAQTAKFGKPSWPKGRTLRFAMQDEIRKVEGGKVKKAVGDRHQTTLTILDSKDGQPKAWRVAIQKSRKVAKDGDGGSEETRRGLEGKSLQIKRRGVEEIEVTDAKGKPIPAALHADLGFQRGFLIEDFDHAANRAVLSGEWSVGDSRELKGKTARSLLNGYFSMNKIHAGKGEEFKLTLSLKSVEGEGETRQATFTVKATSKIAVSPTATLETDMSGRWIVGTGDGLTRQASFTASITMTIQGQAPKEAGYTGSLTITPVKNAKAPEKAPDSPKPAEDAKPPGE